MIAFNCPKCGATLRVPPSMAGRAGKCSKCLTPLLVPGPAAKPAPPTKAKAPKKEEEVYEDFEVVEDEEEEVYDDFEVVEEEAPAAETRLRAGAAPRRKEALREKARPARERHDDEDEEPEEEERPRKKRRRQARESEGTSTGLLLGLGAGVFVLWIGLAVLGYFFQAVNYVPLVVGGVMIWAGSRWILKLAYEEGMGTYLCCLFVPLYETWYTFSRIGQTWVPCLLCWAGRLLGGTAIILLVIHFISSEGGRPDDADTLAETLPEARRGFQTSLVAPPGPRKPAPVPPAGVFRLVRYGAPVGQLEAYLTPDPADGQKHPAIIWITGGDCNTIDEGCWSQGPEHNDQSAATFRRAGLVMMFPSLRGGNANLGRKEGFLGEVDDVLAAADYLAKQPYVDPKRIYLGGHSTGGTLAMLVAASTDRFRAVFSFGPADDVSGYPPELLPFDTSDSDEVRLRSPGLWLHSVRCPTFVFEGEGGNIDSLQTMRRASTNPKLHFLAVSGANHFSLLAPTTRLIAEKVLRDKGPTTNLTFTEAEVSARVRR